MYQLLIESRYDFLIRSNSWARIDLQYLIYILDSQINSKKRKNKVNNISNHQSIVFNKNLKYVVMSSMIYF